jgi:hypothetical protein
VVPILGLGYSADFNLIMLMEKTMLNKYAYMPGSNGGGADEGDEQPK